MVEVVYHIRDIVIRNPVSLWFLRSSKVCPLTRDLFIFVIARCWCGVRNRDGYNSKNLPFLFSFMWCFFSVCRKVWEKPLCCGTQTEACFPARICFFFFYLKWKENTQPDLNITFFLTNCVEFINSLERWEYFSKVLSG